MNSARSDLKMAFVDEASSETPPRATFINRGSKMKHVLSSVLAMTAFVMFAMTPFISAQTSASAIVTADFEGTVLTEGDTVTSQIAGLTITGGKLVIEGSPGVGFGSQYGDDTVDTGACFDNAFLRPISTADEAIMTIVFDEPTDVLAFTLGDIDPENIAKEGVKITAYNSARDELQSLSIWSDDPGTGDGHGTKVEFSVTGIGYIEIENLDTVAYGIDNINLLSSCLDLDADGYSPPEDCNDNDPFINPDAYDLPGNFVDENCDGNLGACSPCAEWRNHGQYVRCIAQDAEALFFNGILTEEEADALVTSGAQTDIGKKGFVPEECSL